MYNVSNRYKRIIANPGREFKYKADVALQSGQTLELNGHDIMEGGLTVDQTSSVLGQFALGDVTASQLDLQLNNFSGKFEGVDFENAAIVPYVGLEVEQNYETGRVIEWVKMGTFYSEAADTRGPVVDLKAYDGMMKFAIPYTECTISYPATLRQILQSCCDDCGVPLLTRDFTNADYVVSERPEDGALTYRDVVSHVAALAGCFTRLILGGYLELAWYDMEHPTMEFKNVTNFWAQDLTITGVKVGPYRDGEPTYINGEEGYTFDIFDNPLAQENRDVLCRAIGRKIAGFTLRPFSYTGLSNPAVNAGDTAVFYDRKGNQYKTVISYTLYRIGSNQKYSAEAQTPAVKNFTFFSLTDKVQEAAKNDTKKQISNYDTMAKQFASMTANSMGFYTSVEKQDDGSEIWYQHDKEKLEESRVIWKKSLDTMAVSTDGGKTWQGIDKNGNAVLNVLAAHGIVADWIKTGRIEAQNGGAYFDLDKGELSATKLISDKYPDYVTTIGPSELGDYGALNVYDGKDCMLSVYKTYYDDGKAAGVVITAPYLTDSASKNRKGIGIGTDSITLFGDYKGETRGLEVSSATGNGRYFGNLRMYGDIDLGGNRLLNPSDERLKANISNYEGSALEELKKINVCSFDWRENGKHQKYGIIAQQAEQVDPGLVDVSDKGEYSIKPLELIPRLLAAVQELSAEVEKIRKNK